MAARESVTTPSPSSRPAAAREEPTGPREFLKYTFYKVGATWRTRLPPERRADAAEFSATLEALRRELGVRPYLLVGLRGDCDFMTWTIADRVETLVEVERRLRSTALGAHLETPYSYLAMRRKSVYLEGHSHAGQDGAGTARAPVGARFLFVYPFTKKREWYSLPFEERRRMMGEHFRVGHKFPRIAIHTGYSFGLDDQEFMLGFEGDDPGEFLDLVMELRSSEASRYTAVETPIFTCLATKPSELVAALGV
jgi:chlorite dismutase